MMKFYSFLQALSFHSKCPICSKPLQINDRDLVSRAEYPIGHPYQTFSFYIGSGTDDTMILNPYTEEIEVQHSRHMNPAYYGTGTGAITHSSNYSIYNGLHYQALTISCNSCCQYHYTLQIQADLTERRLIGTYLNSETISVKEGNMVHEVKNVYSMEKTEYAYFPKDGSSKRSSIPLVPLNLSDPKETIARIRKLLIFS